MDSTGNSIRRLFQLRGNSQYGGEAVTQLEHALQTASLARQERAEDSLVVAALLHDIGHLLHVLPDDAPDRDIDDLHEDRAATWLAKRFGPNVTEPVRLHVAAKRYLCAVDPDYMSQLSSPSMTSLRLQGGAMSPAEVAAFEMSPHRNQALKLRRWDDAAKIPGLVTAPLDELIALIDRVALSDRVPHWEDPE